MTTLHVNGKWLAQRLTGTQRYAGEIVHAILREDSVDLVVHVPAGATVPEWLTHPRATIRIAPVKGVVFEQLYLPVVTAGRLLLNFAGPAPLLKKRQLVTMHDATPFRHPHTFRRAFVWFYYVSYFLLGRRADRLVTVSHFSAAELDDVLGIPAERFTVAGCAADALVGITPARPDLDGLTGPFYLMVGTMARHKNLTAPVTAVAESGRTVVVVGASGNQQVFSDAAPLNGRAVIAGRLSDAELSWLYRNAAALVFPSKYEGFGLPPLEAQSLGCPVLSSAAASLPEVAGAGAVYFDPDDPQTLLAALDRLESDPALVAELRRLGSENASRYRWQSSARAVLDTLGAAQPSSL
ncbi:glycosyltransferase family 1 protein [Mycobacterium sp. AMU20-3851]|uniref:glycosyltransferase family 4 protein n=1 Tax=Mycobacterium sp. AMU20-3851 TaxID=3122055 RepID=UPI00375524A4